MSMFEITGQLISCLDDRALDRETGEMQDKPRIQLLGDIPLRHSDQNRKELVTLTVEDLKPYRDLVGKTIRLPFGMFSPNKGQVIQFVPKGSLPKVAQGAG